MLIDATRLMLRLRSMATGRVASAPDDGADGPILGTTDDGGHVRLPTASAATASHIAVFGASGSGKTILMSQALAREYLLSRQHDAPERQLTLFVVDPKGDLVLALIEAFAALAPDVLGRVAYLNPFSGSAFPFNLSRLELGATPIDIFATQLAGLVAETSTATGAQRHLGAGARQMDVLTNTLLAALAVDHARAHPLLALDALLEPNALAKLGRVTTSERAKAFCLSARLSDELRASCAARLRASLSTTSQLERLVTAPSCIQFAELLAPGRIVLVDLGAPPAGLVALSTFWANLVARLAIEHVMERPSPFDGWHVRLVVDEAQMVAATLSESAERVLTTGRSRGTSLSLLTQGTTLLAAASPTLLRTVMANTRTRCVGRLSAPDAELFVRDIAPARGSDESIGTVRARVAAAIATLDDRRFFLLEPGKRQAFTSLPVDLAEWGRAAQREAATIDVMKLRLAVPQAPAPRLTLDELAQPPRPRRPGPARPRSRWG